MTAVAPLAPIYGNLLHHAVEMYLKIALAGVVSPQDIRKKYRHDLQKLWRRFKTKEADATLDRFDATIRSLHKFEELRYPDTLARAGISLSLIWQSSDAGQVEAPAGTQKYEVAISDVDRLVFEIMKRIPLDPKFFMPMLGQSGEALRYQNPHAADWLTPESGPA